MHRPDFAQALRETILVCDGAMGTMIYARGVYINRCFDELNLSDPDLISRIHNNYINAGADVIETNTFGANRHKLSRHALGDSQAEIIAAGVKLAREAAEGSGVYVAGSVGPLGTRIKGAGGIGEQEAAGLFAGHIRCLAEAGVDLVMLETFTDAEELALALSVARDSFPELPVVAQLVANEKGFTCPRRTLEESVDLLLPHHPTAVGLNCRLDADQMLPLLERMRRVTDLPLTCLPNSGEPRTVEDRQIFLSTPEFMAEYTRRFIRNAGVRMAGGCCGTTPAHIKAIAAAVRSLRPGRITVGVARAAEPAARPKEPDLPWSEKSPFAAKLAAGKFVSSVEIRPPRGTDISGVAKAQSALAWAGVDAMNIPDGPRASARMHPIAVAAALKNSADIEIIFHYTCRDRNLLGIQADLLGACSQGLRNIMAVTGDPPKLGDYPDATAVYDVDAIGLVSIISRFNRGEDLAGNPLGGRTCFLIGVGANPGAVNLDEEVRRLRAKIDSGAEFVFTQPVYEMDLLLNFLDRVGDLAVPVLSGLLPLYSFKNAEFLHNEVPGMSVPEAVRARMHSAGTGPAAQAEGVAIAREALARVRDRVQGAYVMPPFDKWELALKVLDGFIEKPEGGKNG